MRAGRGAGDVGRQSPLEASSGIIGEPKSARQSAAAGCQTGETRGGEEQQDSGEVWVMSNAAICERIK